MPRKLRIEYAGAMYHVMSRGDQREAIFQDDEDRQKFLMTLGEACQKTEWQVHAYCLMRGEDLKEPGRRPGWLRVDRLLGEKGIPRDSEVGRRQLALLTEKRRAEESTADYEALRRDWVLG